MTAMPQVVRRRGRGVCCPKCSGGSHVIDSRSVTGAVRRRRRCGSCSHRFTTYEMMVRDLDLIDKIEGVADVLGGLIDELQSRHDTLNEELKKRFEKERT